MMRGRIIGSLRCWTKPFFGGIAPPGQNEVVQCVWVYEHPCRFDGLRRFHHNLGYGLLGRRIERSPLPFGRCRWVSDPGPRTSISLSAPVHVLNSATGLMSAHNCLLMRNGARAGILASFPLPTARPRSPCGFPLPGRWHRFPIEMVGMVLGNARNLGYPPPRSRTRLRAVVQDARQTAQDAPEGARALVAGKTARRRRHDVPPITGIAIRRPPGGDGDDPVVVPGITIRIDLDDWDNMCKGSWRERVTRWPPG